MKSEKNKKLEELAYSIDKKTNEISNDNIYKQMIEVSRNQILYNQNNINDKKLILRIFSDLKSGTIELNTLNAVTSGLQNVFTSAYNNIFGNGKDRGKIPGWITDSSSLVLTGVGKGSFIVELENIDEINEKPEQIDFIQENEQKNDIITNLLTFLNEDDDSGIENIIKEYGVRTFNTSKGWFKNMEQNKVSFEYKDSYNNKTERFNSDQIKNISSKQ